MDHLLYYNGAAIFGNIGVTRCQVRILQDVLLQTLHKRATLLLVYILRRSSLLQLLETITMIRTMMTSINLLSESGLIEEVQLSLNAYTAKQRHNMQRNEHTLRPLINHTDLKAMVSTLGSKVRMLKADNKRAPLSLSLATRPQS